MATRAPGTRRRTRSAVRRQVYDRILVYGQRDIWDVVEVAGLSARAAAKVRYVGYLRRELGYRSPSELRAQLGPNYATDVNFRVRFEDGGIAVVGEVESLH